MIKTNHIQLIGNLGKDAECKILDSGKAVVSVSIATSEKWKDKETKEWHNLELWREKSEMAEKVAASLRKGKRLVVQGKMKYGSYTKTIGTEEATFRTAVVVVSDYFFISTNGEPLTEDDSSDAG